jgi:ABC-type multidrug transport system fused ATPase/permease subunit/acyl-CoA synthetase (AMP-forming)/AMP-acid ligase II
MSISLITPTEALLEVAKHHPFLTAVKCREDQWSYAALWARVRQIAAKIHDLDDTRNPIGLYTGLEIDYVAAAHAIWLSGRTVVFLSSKWTPAVLQTILERANAHLVLFGSSQPPAVPGVRAISTFSLVDSMKPPSHVVPPSSEEVVETIPLISSITPTSGSTGVPKSIVYPMRRSLAVLSEESSAHLKPMDGQWLRGGTTFLRPLFEIRRFMFNRTTLYLDASTSVADQCNALCEELESTRSSQILRVHFTPSVFRAFADYAQMRAGGSRLPRGFNRVYWMVIGGESLDVRDLELATVIFPTATIACNYACSEVGFAGISQMFIRPTDSIPSAISFGPTQGCTDLILLDESLSVIPRSEEGATGIVGFITSQSATHYLDNEEASQHMFRPWAGDDILLYTDDIGCMQADGTIAIRGRSSRNVKINGLFVDLDYVERALAPAFADKSLNITGFKLVKSNATQGIVLFVGTRTADAMFVLKHARDHLRVSLSDELALVISSARCVPEMPFNASYKIDLVELQKMADSTEILPPGCSAHAPATTPLSKLDALAEKIAAEVTRLSKSPDAIPTDLPLVYSGLTSITMVRLHFWLQSEYEYLEQMPHLFEEDVTAQTVALEILSDEEGVIEAAVNISITPASPFSQSTVVDEEGIDALVLEKDPDYPIEKGHGHYPPPAFNSRHASTLIVMQPPIETTVPDTVNDVANHPTLHYTPYSFLFVSWMTPLLFLGSKRPLLESDLLPLRRSDEATIVERWVDPFWTQLRAWYFDRNRKNPKLFGTIFAAARNLWLISGVLWFLSVCSAILAPLMLQQIIVATNAPAPPVGNATALAEYNSVIESDTGGFPLIVYDTYALAGMLMGLKLIYSFCGRSSDQLVKRMALDVKTTLISAVYKKSLRLSAENNQKYGKGYIMNLVNVDCESVSKAWEVIHQVWSIPLQLVSVTVFLSRLLGVSAWASVGVLLFSLFLLIMVVPVFMRKAAPWFMRLGDRRLKTIREVLDGIRVVKINGREKHFLAKLEGIRTEQLHWLRKFNTGVATFVIVGQVANTVMPLAAFSLFGHENMGKIAASRVFPALSFFGMLVDPLISLPQLLSAFVIAATSWGRIYSFLLAEEKTSTNDSSLSLVNIGHAVTIINGGFSWTALDSDDAPAPAQVTDNQAETSSIDKVNEEEVPGPVPFLHDVNISIPRGSLTAIVGNVGSGKSSLLSAIIGEMVRVSGEVYCNGSIAYCAQQPWIQTSTIQDNILFGRPLDMRQLQKAIQTTCFDSDLETFTHGMATEMSEKGNNLSGGQKARLALSRAVYSDADIYLFDDVLSALDPRVGRTVFNNCIRHALEGKTRVLVTHQLQYLNQVDHIIVVSDGTIVEQGSFENLLARNGELTRLLSDVQTTSEDSNDNTKKDEKRKSASAPAKAAVKQEETADKIIADEERNKGAVGAATWWAYLKATGGTWMIVMLLLELLLLQSSVVILNQWLTWWTEESWDVNAQGWIGIYNGIGFASVLAIVILNITILMSTIRASRTFHSKALNGVIHAPIWWFESQPIGRIMNRFSKDIEAIDQRLMPQLFQLVAGVGNLISTVIILGYSTPIMLAFVFPMVVLYWFVLRFYRKSLRELKRLESTGRGPLQSRISETLDGIPTIMAYGRETDFANAVGGLLDASNKPTFLRIHAEIWVTLRMEIMSSSIVFALAMLAHSKVVGSSTQFVLALTYASTLTYIMNLLLKSAANVEAEMNSVERLMNYTDSLPKEDPTQLGSDPAEGAWPSRGEIVLRDIDAAYHSRPDKLVLRNVNLTFNAGETVFIVGRTGSGKSTLLSLLLRMIESSNGSVEIDGRDIKSLGVSTLRRGLQVIPQDPFIFSGTIRSSLDFDGKHSDDALWHALDLVGLKKFVTSQESKLDTVVEDNGSNYSVGQRQLMCLAAAILRNPKILLLDEATASIDAGADVFIQQAMRQSCPDATILSVMHRLNDNILKECDKVLVMEQGVPIEYAPPEVLLARPNSMFSKLMAAARNSH